MNKDEYWSVDRLLPRVQTAFSDTRNVSGIPLSQLSGKAETVAFGPSRHVSSSRVIRSYRITSLAFPQNDLILQGRKNDNPLPFVPCNLFSPSMLSLDARQREYFYYFCQSVEKRKKIRTSFAYLRLYLCRLLRGIEITSGVPREIFWIWETYREEFPLCDKLFSDFVSDWCFCKGITPPWESLSNLLLKPNFTVRTFLADPFIFDYLFATDHKMTPSETAYLLRTLTGLSFRNSKAYKTNSVFAAACEEAIGKAVQGGLFNRPDLNESLFSIQIPSEVHSVRALFSGLSGEECVRGQISLHAVPLLHDMNIRDRCDELIRYLENRLRAIMKIKNALSRIHISQTHKAYLEAILLEFIHLAPKEDTPSDEPTFQAAVPREIQVDPEAAEEIESASWEITRALTTEYADGSEETVTVGEAAQQEMEQIQTALEDLSRTAPLGSGDFWEFAATLSPEEDRFLSLCIYNGSAAARAYAQSLGAFFEAMVASCNEKATDAVGDAVMDGAGNVFEDYRREMQEVFPELKGDESHGS